MRRTGRSRPSRSRASAVTAVALLAVLTALLVGCQPGDGRDIGITVNDGPSWLAPGETKTFTVTVTNHGTAPATGSEANIFTTTELAATGISAGGPCDHLAQEALAMVSCPVGTLPAGASAIATFTLTGSTAPATHTVEIRGNSDTPDADPDVAVNADTLTIHVGTGGEVDLQASGSRTPAASLPGVAFTSRTTVTNHGVSAASGVTVTQSLPATVALLGATLERVDGGATGTCTVSTGLATCSTGTALVEPFASTNDQWFLDATVKPADTTSFTVAHDVSSPHPEAQPQVWSNTDQTVLQATNNYLTFAPTAPVPVGGIVEVTGNWVTTYPLGGYGNYLSVVTPAGFEFVDATVNGAVYTCVPGGGGCIMLVNAMFISGPFTFRFRAIAATAPVQVGVSFSSEMGGVSGEFTLQAYHITSATP